jgi:hypothetical protein
MDSEQSDSRIEVSFPSQAFDQDEALKTYAAAISIGSASIPTTLGLSKEYSLYICLNPCERPYGASQGVQNATAYEATMLSSYSLIITATRRQRSFYMTEHKDAFAYMIKAGLRVPMLRSVPILHSKDPMICEDDKSIDIIDQYVSYRRVTQLENSKSDAPIKIVVARAMFSSGWVVAQSELNAALSRACGERKCMVHIIAEGTVETASIESFIKQLPVNIDLKVLVSASKEIVSRVITRSDQFWSLTPSAFTNNTSSPRAVPCLEFFTPDPDIVQAMYCSVPVIAFDVCDNSELIPAIPSKTIDRASSKQSLVVDSVRNFGDLSLAITNADHGIREKYLRTISNAARDLALRELNKRFMKLFLKQLLHSRYTSFALDRIGKLRSQGLSVALASKLLALTVEPWLHPTLEFAVRNVMHHLGPRWSLQIIHSDSNGALLQALFSDLQHVKYTAMSAIDEAWKEVWSAQDYSDVLKSKQFWQRLKRSGYEHVLIFQSDSLMLHGRIEPFLRYDYIGAPWCGDSPHVSRLRQKEHVLPNGIGNGGFSLRRVDAMIRAIDAPAQFKGAKKLSEDLFFASFLDTSENSARFPNRSAGFAFSIEVQCSHESDSHISASNVPLGVHAAWLFGKRYRDSLFQVMDMHFMK